LPGRVMAELPLTVEGARGETRREHLDFAEVFEKPGLLSQRVELLGRQLLPTAIDFKAFYLDDTGGECSLTAATAADAAAFAVERRGLLVFLRGAKHIEVGAVVRLLQDMRSGSLHPVELKRGQRGVVLKMDDGDASVNFEGKGLQWVSKHDFNKLEIEEAQDLVVVATIGEGETFHASETISLVAARADPGLLVRIAERLGCRALGDEGSTGVRVCYRDEENDLCRLTAETASDALSFASVSEGGRYCLRLSVSPATQAARRFGGIQAHGQDRNESCAGTDSRAAIADGELASCRGEPEPEEPLGRSVEKDRAIRRLQQELLDERQQATERIHLLEEEAAACRVAEKSHAAELEAAWKADEERVEQLSRAQRAEEAAVERAEGAERKLSASIEQLQKQLARAAKDAEGAECFRKAAASREARLRSELAETSARVEAATRRAEDEVARVNSDFGELRREAVLLRAANYEQALKETSIQESAHSLQKELEHARREASVAKQRLAYIDKDAQATKALDVAASGVAVSSEPEIAGVEDHREDPRARCDVSNEFAAELKELGCRQAFRIGRVQLRSVPLGELLHEECFPVCYSVVLQNSGRQRWPATAALVHAAGDAMDLPLLPLGALRPGERTKVALDLRVPQMARPPREPTSRSMWVVRDAATGKPFGPVLIFDVQWTCI